MARGRTQGRRADYNWIGGTGQISSVAETNALGTGFVVIDTASTIVRVRGNLLASLDFVAVDERYVLGVGLIVVTDAAAVAGAASLPSPTDNADAEWLWHQFIPLATQTAAQTDSNGNQSRMVEIDSKAMRKVKTNSRLVMVADGVRQAGAPVCDVTYGFRMLLAV